MKRILALTIATFTAFTIAATSLTTTAQAGKRERGIAAGVLLGAIGGAIIAKEIQRNKKKRHYRKHHRGHNVYGSRHRRHDVYRSRRDDRGFYYDEYREPVRVRRHSNRGQFRNTSRNSRWQRHVNRCHNRYRSYDQRSDTFIGYDGRERQCRL